MSHDASQLTALSWSGYLGLMSIQVSECSILMPCPEKSRAMGVVFVLVVFDLDFTQREDQAKTLE